MAGELDTVYVYAEEVVDAGQVQLAGGRAQLGDIIMDTDSPSPEDVVLALERADAINRALASMKPEDAKLLDERFGLTTGEPRTLAAIGEDRGLTKERVRQREGKALSKLRHPSRFHLLNPDILA